QLREKLFFGDAESGPKIAKYAGSGSLHGWVRVVATRLLIDATRTSSLELPLEEALFEGIAEGASPEQAALRRRYQQPIREALAQAIAELEPQLQFVLRCEVSGMSSAEIAEREGVHARTVQRRLAQAHQALEHAFSRVLAARLGCTPDEA